MSRVNCLPVLVVAIAAALGLCASAQAQITIGEVAPPNPPVVCSFGSFDAIPARGAASAYTVPATGAITSWSTSASAGGGQEMMLKIFHPTGEGPEKYIVAGHDGPRQLTASTLNTFKAALPVKAGDVIAESSANLEAAPSACLFGTTSPNDEVLDGESGADGSPFIPDFGETFVRTNISATFLPAPTISSLSLASGSIEGGSSVVITGSNLAEIKSVTFGSSSASSYVDNSEGQITAVSPAATAAGSVPISVTTLAGTATSTQSFTYTSVCAVPKLNGKKLKAAKKKLKAADCKLGKVKKLKGATTKTGKVKSQNPKQGKVLAPGAKVNVKLTA